MVDYGEGRNPLLLFPCWRVSMGSNVVYNPESKSWVRKDSKDDTTNASTSSNPNYGKSAYEIKAETMKAKRAKAGINEAERVSKPGESAEEFRYRLNKQAKERALAEQKRQEQARQSELEAEQQKKTTQEIQRQNLEGYEFGYTVETVSYDYSDTGVESGKATLSYRHTFPYAYPKGTMVRVHEGAGRFDTSEYAGRYEEFREKSASFDKSNPPGLNLLPVNTISKEAPKYLTGVARGIKEDPVGSAKNLLKSAGVGVAYGGVRYGITAGAVKVGGVKAGIIANEIFTGFEASAGGAFLLKSSLEANKRASNAPSDIKTMELGYQQTQDIVSATGFMAGAKLGKPVAQGVAKFINKPAPAHLQTTHATKKFRLITSSKKGMAGKAPKRARSVTKTRAKAKKPPKARKTNFRLDRNKNEIIVEQKQGSQYLRSRVKPDGESVARKLELGTRGKKMVISHQFEASQPKTPRKTHPNQILSKMKQAYRAEDTAGKRLILEKMVNIERAKGRLSKGEAKFIRDMANRKLVKLPEISFKSSKAPKVPKPQPPTTPKAPKDSGQLLSIHKKVVNLKVKSRLNIPKLKHAKTAQKPQLALKHRTPIKQGGQAPQAQKLSTKQYNKAMSKPATEKGGFRGDMKARILAKAKAKKLAFEAKKAKLEAEQLKALKQKPLSKSKSKEAELIKEAEKSKIAEAFREVHKPEDATKIADSFRSLKKPILKVKPKAKLKPAQKQNPVKIPKIATFAETKRAEATARIMSDRNKQADAIKLNRANSQIFKTSTTERIKEQTKLIPVISSFNELSKSTSKSRGRGKTPTKPRPQPALRPLEPVRPRPPRRPKTTRRPPTRPQIGGLSFNIPLKPKTRAAESPLFNVEVRKGGVWQKLNTAPTTEAKAFNMGLNAVDSTPAVSLRLTDLQGRPQKTGKTSKKLRKKGSVLIELSKFRIDTQGEILGLRRGNYEI